MSYSWRVVLLVHIPRGSLRNEALRDGPLWHLTCCHDTHHCIAHVHILAACKYSSTTERCTRSGVSARIVSACIKQGIAT